MYESVIYEVDRGVAHIRLDQPEKRNSLDETTTRELTDCLLKAQADPQAHVMLLTAAGNAFSAGGDLREFQQKLTQPSLQIYDEGKSSAELFKVLGVLSKPLIGAVKVGGMTLIEAQAVIEAKLAQYLVSPQVSLFIRDC